MIWKSNCLSIAAAATFLCATSAFSPEDYGAAEQRAACTSDAFRLCSSDIPDATKVETCLRRNKSGLSNACRSVFEQGAGPVARLNQAAPEQHGQAILLWRGDNKADEVANDESFLSALRLPCEQAKVEKKNGHDLYTRPCVVFRISLRDASVDSHELGDAATQRPRPSYTAGCVPA